MKIKIKFNEVIFMKRKFLKSIPLLTMMVVLQAFGSVDNSNVVEPLQTFHMQLSNIVAPSVQAKADWEDCKIDNSEITELPEGVTLGITPGAKPAPDSVLATSKDFLALTGQLPGQTQAVTDKIIIIVNGKIVTGDAEAYSVSSRTMVPIRLISENLGAKVDWDNTTKGFTITKDTTVILGTANKSQVTVNNATKFIDADSKVVVESKNGRIYAPLRFFAENLNCTVAWDNTTKTVTVTTK